MNAQKSMAESEICDDEISLSMNLLIHTLTVYTCILYYGWIV